MILEALLYSVFAPFTANYYDLLVFFRATKMLLQGLNPYSVNPNNPLIYLNPVTYPQWFAYPPLSLIIWALFSLPLWLSNLFNIFTFRIILKLVTILSAFWIAWRMEYLRKGSYKYVIFNPLIWFVASVHGMNDVIATALFVEALWRLYKNDKRYWVFYSLALATKQITWITIPAFLGYWIRKEKLKDLLWTVLLFSLIVLPFINGGFIHYVFAFHEGRPPTLLGYTGIPLILLAGDVSTFHIVNVIAPCFGKPLPSPGIGSYILSAMFIATLILSFIKSLEGSFIGSMALASLGFILFSKVISPQNLVLPLIVFMLANAPYVWLVLPSVFAALVEASLGTPYGVLGYLAEDVFNSLGTSMTHVYRALGNLEYMLVAPALPALLLYHVSVVFLIYRILKNKMDIKKFLMFYILYISLALVAVNVSNSKLVTIPSVVKPGKIAVIWPWLNPYNGLKAGDYLWMKIDPKVYWEYTYPLVLRELKWLRAHGYTTVGLVFSLDRAMLYEYVPWLFGISKLHMNFVWVIVPPHVPSDYIKGWASYSDSKELANVLKSLYRLTPVYINSKIRIVNKLINNTYSLALCPLSYPNYKGKPIVYVYGNIPKVDDNDIVLKKLPKESVLVNDFYYGHVLWGTPITPRRGH